MLEPYSGLQVSKKQNVAFPLTRSRWPSRPIRKYLNLYENTRLLSFWKLYIYVNVSTCWSFYVCEYPGQISGWSAVYERLISVSGRPPDVDINLYDQRRVPENHIWPHSALLVKARSRGAQWLCGGSRRWLHVGSTSSTLTQRPANVWTFPDRGDDNEFGMRSRA